MQTTHQTAGKTACKAIWTAMRETTVKAIWRAHWKTTGQAMVKASV